VLHRIAQLGAALIALLPMLWLTPRPALATSPYPTPTTANQLACDLSPSANPGEYSSWWQAVPSRSTYSSWLWNDIIPSGSSACRTDVANTFWNQAVPANWVSVGNIGGWPWPAGGYYTQNLWLRAIPQNWAVVPDIGGWPWSTGGYYTQVFWLHAVPDNWVSVANIGGWPWPAGGYYTQWLWLHGIRDSWAPAANLSLGHMPASTAMANFSQGNQGYYRYWFWEGAVPDNWVSVANLGGWPWSTGGYYTQWFWLHAAPDEWAVNPDMAIDGKAGVGYYDYNVYHFATVRDFAWRDFFSIGGSSGAGYYDYWYHGSLGQSLAHFRQLLSLAGGYLANASGFQPVSTWLDPAAQAGVILTFDTEGSEAETCAVTDVLNRQGIPGTFYLAGATAAELTPTWVGCLSGMDIGNHSLTHPGSFGLDTALYMDALTDANQQHEIQGVTPLVRAMIPGAAVTSFRTPWCDGNKSFDGSVIRNLIASGMTSDRSVATISNQARAAGVVPPLGLSAFSLSAFPAPFVVGSADGHALVELPFSYPSDWTSSAINALDPSSAPPFRGAPGYTVSLWEDEFDEIYSRHGVMVVLMHPWIQASGGTSPSGLNALIDYMKTKPGVAFTTVQTANRSVRAARGLPQR
jgi:peptidoglycan/xylan/chitin deacetylase (PgdA/CDA1 family)